MLKSLFSRDYATCDNNDKNDDRQPIDFEKKSFKQNCSLKILAQIKSKLQNLFLFRNYQASYLDSN